MIDWEAFYNRFRQPDFLPGYEIGHRLGGGAFGDVYLARKRSIGKAYAVKFLKLEAGQQDAVERELEHVRLFAAIDHPNLVTIEDMGVVMGVPFLILGYAGEDTLARRLKRGELTREGSISFFVQACRGVLALHDRRLAHFDLKPSNVFLRGEVARVGDYGLARLLSDGRATLSFGRGTPQYMAPEMLRNRADHRADIYSLGVILFESMTGQLPYPSQNEIGLALRETDEPPRFSADFPSPLRIVVERCLRLDPRARYQSVHELLDELGQSARQGDSVVIPWTTNGLVTPVPAGGGAPTPPGGAPPPLLAAPPPPPPTPPRSAPAAAASATKPSTPATPGAAPVPPAPETTGVGGRVRAVLTELRETRERAQSVLRPANPTASAPATASATPTPPSAQAPPSTATPPSVPGSERRASEDKLLEKLGAARASALTGTSDAAKPSEAAREAADAVVVPAPRPAPQFHGDVVSLSTLDEHDDPAPVGRFASPAEVAREARRAASEPSDDGVIDPLSTWVAAGAAAGGVAPPPLLAAAATIPVPPRVEGGLWASAYAVFVLGLEVLLTLIFGPLTLGAQRSQEWMTSSLDGAPSSGGRWVLLGFQMAVAALLGALLSSSLVFFVRGG